MGHARLLAALGAPYGSPNWGDISEADDYGNNAGSAFTAGGTRTITITISSKTGAASAIINPNINGVPGSGLAVSNGANTSFSHPVGQSCYFEVNASGTPPQVINFTVTVSIAGVPIDTFTVGLQAV